MKLHDDLGVKADATESDIRKAYRKRAKATHPDQDGGDEDDFKRVAHAMAVLGDPARRAHYERTGDDGRANPVDHVRQAALALVAAQVTAAVQSDMASAVNFQANAMGFLKSEIAKLKLQDDHTDRSIVKAQKNRKRWKLKQGKPDVLAPILDAYMREREMIKAKIKEAIEIHEMAVDIISGYDYELDPGAGQLASLQSPLLAALTGQGGAFATFKY